MYRGRSIFILYTVTCEIIFTDYQYDSLRLSYECIQMPNLNSYLLALEYWYLLKSGLFILGSCRYAHTLTHMSKNYSNEIRSLALSLFHSHSHSISIIPALSALFLLLYLPPLPEFNSAQAWNSQNSIFLCKHHFVEYST